VIDKEQSLNAYILNVVLALSFIFIPSSVPEVGEMFVLQHYLCPFIALALCICSVMCHRERHVHVQLEESVYAMGCDREHHVQ
jgi:hypothetical protein